MVACFAPVITLVNEFQTMVASQSLEASARRTLIVAARIYNALKTDGVLESTLDRATEVLTNWMQYLRTTATMLRRHFVFLLFLTKSLALLPTHKPKETGGIVPIVKITCSYGGGRFISCSSKLTLLINIKMYEKWDRLFFLFLLKLYSKIFKQDFLRFF